MVVREEKLEVAGFLTEVISSIVNKKDISTSKGPCSLRSFLLPPIRLVRGGSVRLETQERTRAPGTSLNTPTPHVPVSLPPRRTTLSHFSLTVRWLSDARASGPGPRLRGRACKVGRCTSGAPGACVWTEQKVRPGLKEVLQGTNPPW